MEVSCDSHLQPSYSADATMTCLCVLVTHVPTAILSLAYNDLQCTDLQMVYENLHDMVISLDRIRQDGTAIKVLPFVRYLWSRVEVLE